MMTNEEQGDSVKMHVIVLMAIFFASSFSVSAGVENVHKNNQLFSTIQR